MEVILFIVVFSLLAFFIVYLLGWEEEIEIKDAVLLRSWKRKFKNDIIMSIIRGHEINTIGKDAFSCYISEKVIVSEGIKKIKSGAFKNCNNLSYVELPKSIELIEEDAFNYSNLKNLKIPKNNKHYKVENNALLSKDGSILYHVIGDLEEYIVSEGIKKIECGSFKNCNNLLYIELPESIETIERGAFNYKKLIKISVHENNKHYKIENNALVSKDGSILYNVIGDHKEYEIKGQVKIIDDHAFSYTSIKEINIPEGVERIGRWAFYSTFIKELNIPQSVRTIDDYAFSVRSLEKLTILNGLEKIGNGAFSYTSIKEINIPRSVCSIGDYAFSDTLLEKINIDRSYWFFHLGFEWNGNCRNIMVGGVHISTIIQKDKQKKELESNKRVSVSKKFDDLLIEIHQRSNKNSFSYGYENHCWRCGRHISSQNNSQCSNCKWYICSCGACSRSCHLSNSRT